MLFSIVARRSASGIAARRLCPQATRQLSTMVQASDKIHDLLQDFREKQYGQQLLFERYVKEMVVASDSNFDGKLNVSELQGLLQKLGADDVASKDLAAVLPMEWYLEDVEDWILGRADVDDIVANSA